MTSLVDAPYALCYRLPIGYEPPNRLVSEIFCIKVADTETHTQTRRLTIRVTAHEPTKYPTAIKAKDIKAVHAHFNCKIFIKK